MAGNTMTDVIGKTEKGVLKLAKRTQDHLLEPTETWDHDVESEIIGPFRRGKDLVCQVVIRDPIYYWLNYGTRRRYATMTEDFEPKTHVRSFKSRQGRGGRAYINKRRPRPGIEARNWVDEDEVTRPESEKSGVPTLAKIIVESAVTSLLEGLGRWAFGKRRRRR